MRHMVSGVYCGMVREYHVVDVAQFIHRWTKLVDINNDDWKQYITDVDALLGRGPWERRHSKK